MDKERVNFSDWYFMSVGLHIQIGLARKKYTSAMGI
jgi:hypothetical protein